MTEYFNDNPIEDFGDDRYGITPFAKALAKGLLSIKNPIGTTVALTGPWGSGKSSAVNLVRRALEAEGNEALTITEFKPWWFRGEEALALAFLQHLHFVLRKTRGEKVGSLVRNVARGVLQTGKVVGPLVAATTANPAAAIIPGVFDWLGRFFNKGDTLEGSFRKLTKALEGQSSRLLVIIDDIDRLSPDEALAVFRLVKSVGRLPNVMYLMAFDRQLADKAVAEKFPSEGPHFLEKIIQATFELPPPQARELNESIFAAIQDVCGGFGDDKVRRFMNIFYDVVMPRISTPRHVTRFKNNINLAWPAIKSEIDVADFMALEVLRLYEPQLFANIRASREEVCGSRSQSQDRRNPDRFAAILSGVPEGNHDYAKIALQRLFPHFEEMGYGSGFGSQWDYERRVCVEKHFDTYFALSLNEAVLSMPEIEAVIAKADDATFLQRKLRDAARTKRKDGTSLVPVFFDALNAHARDVPKEKVASLCAALFEIHDEIDLETDAGRGFMAIENTSLRYHWLIRRLTENRFTLEGRSTLYISALEKASLGWLVDFTDSAVSDYFPREGRERGREEDCLTTEAAIPGLKASALAAIEAAANDGSLIHHKDLIYLLYRWTDLSPDGEAKAKAWTQAAMESDAAMAILARAFTGESWSMGVGGFGGGLGDRVSVRSVQAKIDEDSKIIDHAQFRQRLQQMSAEGKLDEKSLNDVRTLLAAWEKLDK